MDFKTEADQERAHALAMAEFNRSGDLASTGRVRPKAHFDLFDIAGLDQAILEIRRKAAEHEDDHEARDAAVLEAAYALIAHTDEAANLWIEESIDRSWLEENEIQDWEAA